MARFKVVKVHSFRYKDKRYAQGDIVELPEEDVNRFSGADFLEPIREEPEKEEKTRKRG